MPALISQTHTDLENGTVVSTNTARFIYDTWGTLQGFILNDSETYLYVKNLQGDIIAIVDELGEVIVEYSYDAWGNVTFHETSLQNMTKASTLCFVSPFTYRGYCYDYDIELYYLQSRYYSAEVGRFINTDDTQIAIATQGEILGANLFAYCNNNPVMNVDYKGTFPVHIVAGIALSVAWSVIPRLLNDIKKGRFSSLIDYVSDAITGAVAGLVTSLTGSSTLGSVLGTLLGEIARYLLQNGPKLKTSNYKTIILDFIPIICKGVLAGISSAMAGKLIKTVSRKSFTPKQIRNYFKNTKYLKSAFGIGKGGKTGRNMWFYDAGLTTVLYNVFSL